MFRVLWFNLTTSSGRLKGEDPMLRVSINRGTHVICTTSVCKDYVANTK